jgi:16S rRNA (cytidine1402-2'-O)-methyltransferase
MKGTVYLIPTVLHEGIVTPLPAYLLEAVRSCDVLFVEVERTARRYLKLLSKDIVIEDFEWFNMQEVTPETEAAFREKAGQNKTIGIISEAGCPGVADPGQKLVALAHIIGAQVKPLVGPSSILLALMASGLNGQQFQFCGYLPIAMPERIAAVKALESLSRQKSSTQIFIETPYRNDQLLEVLVKTLHPATKVCVAADLTAPDEMVVTKTAQAWKSSLPKLHKRPAIFLLYAGAE